MSRLLRILFLFYPFAVAAQTAPIDVAAAHFHPQIEWHSASALTGDFSCQGRQEQAIAGKTSSELVVAIFLNGPASSPLLMRYASASKERAPLELVAERQDFDVRKIEQMLGEVPAGLRPSKTCKGIHLINGKRDSIHIYWNHDKRLFDYWLF